MSICKIDKVAVCTIVMIGVCLYLSLLLVLEDEKPDFFGFAFLFLPLFISSVFLSVVGCLKFTFFLLDQVQV